MWRDPIVLMAECAWMKGFLMGGANTGACPYGREAWSQMVERRSCRLDMDLMVLLGLRATGVDFFFGYYFVCSMESSIFVANSNGYYALVWECVLKKFYIWLNFFFFFFFTMCSMKNWIKFFGNSRASGLFNSSLMCLTMWAWLMLTFCVLKWNVIWAALKNDHSSLSSRLQCLTNTG